MPGWDPVYLHPQSGEQEPGAIFTTRHDGEETLWFVRRLFPAAGIAEYVRVSPGSRFGTVLVTLGEQMAATTGERAPSVPGGVTTQVTVTYDMTALSDAGRAHLERDEF